jgi:hypothetical protein
MTFRGLAPTLACGLIIILTKSKLEFILELSTARNVMNVCLMIISMSRAHFYYRQMWFGYALVLIISPLLPSFRGYSHFGVPWRW